MDDILEFLEAYKSLDELCKQILSSDKGVSEYIDEMKYENQGYQMVPDWERDYKQLKKMRAIRNRLVHEPHSFEDNPVNAEDIEWLKIFYRRIMECTDSFSLLYQSKNTKQETGKYERYAEDYSSINEITSLENGNLKDEELRNSVMILIAILVCVILTGVILFGMAIYLL